MTCASLAAAVLAAASLLPAPSEEGKAPREACFHAALLARDPAGMERRLEILTAEGSERARILGLHVLWTAAGGKGSALPGRACEAWKSAEVDRICALMKATPSDDVLERSLDNAAVLDNLWATFFATGDDRPVRRLASIAHLVEDGRRMEIDLGGAARWSPTANVRRHPHRPGDPPERRRRGGGRAAEGPRGDPGSGRRGRGGKG